MKRPVYALAGSSLSAGRVRTIVFSAIAALYLAPSCAHAATSAYWRHEEGPSGSIVPDGSDTVLDSSGNGNHMETFRSAFEPFTAATYSPIISPLALRSGLPNTLSLDFGPAPRVGTEDGADPGNQNGRNDDNYTANDKPIEEKLFSAMTVELAFNMNTVGGYQALFGKDGKPLGDNMPTPGEFDSPVPPFKIMVRGDDFPGAVPNQLFVEWIDGDGFAQEDIHFLASGETVVPNRWYHVAVTLASDSARLWVAEATEDGASQVPYTLKDELTGLDFTGSDGRILVQDPTPMSIGRGMFGNGVTDWSDAIIDEVRVSDAALTPEEFLFVTTPSTNDADFNNDQVVDGKDFLIWQQSFGVSGGAGDANGNGQVNADDLAIWDDAFGGAGITAVPEPAGCGLCIAAAIGLASFRRLRK
ncbi:MAG: LamG domain-containing protein [Pirellulales bacterium]|nr:LamG domain-containing protein [Pirellulales bacterium]